METMETRICKECGRELTIEGNFKRTQFGTYSKVCNDCVREKLRATKAAKAAKVEELKQKQEQDARTFRLADFTPRELMQELARRGYEGKLTFTRVETIDITNF